MVLGSDAGTTMAYGREHVSRGSRIFVERSLTGQRRAGGSDVLCGGGGNVWLPPRFLGAAHKLFERHSGCCVHWTDQLDRKSRRFCWSVYRGIHKQQDGIFSWRPALSLGFRGSGSGDDSLSSRSGTKTDASERVAGSAGLRVRRSLRGWIGD